MLAEIAGTTRARVNVFMNKFRKLGFIDYDGDGLRVHKFAAPRGTAPLIPPKTTHLMVGKDSWRRRADYLPLYAFLYRQSVY